LFRIERPVLFYGSLGLALAALAFVLAVPIVAALSFVCGLILDTVVRGRREVRRLAYLALPAPGGSGRRSATVTQVQQQRSKMSR
jgi:hypothetical protein